VKGKNVLEFDLSERCIETAARREYQTLTGAMLDGTDQGTTVDAQIALLARFLRETDFPRLRAKEPRLAGGSNIRVTLRLSADGRMEWRIS